MQNEILLRKLIREMLLNEDEGFGDPGVSDTPQTDNHGNPNYNSTSFTSHSGGGGGGTEDWLYGNIKTVTDPLVKGGKDIAGSVARAGAQVVSIAAILNNPWTTAILGDEWLDKYLDKTEKGNTGQIAAETLKFAFMQELKFKGVNIPQIALLAKSLSIPAVISGFQSYMKLIKNDPKKFQLSNSIFQSLSRINNSLPQMPENIKNIFKLNDLDEKSAQSTAYLIYSKIKAPDFLSQDSENLKNASAEFIEENGGNPQAILQNLITSGMPERKAKAMVAFVYGSNGRPDLANSVINLNAQQSRPAITQPRAVTQPRVTTQRQQRR